MPANSRWNLIQHLKGLKKLLWQENAAMNVQLDSYRYKSENKTSAVRNMYITSVNHLYMKRTHLGEGGGGFAFVSQLFAGPSGRAV